MKLLISVRDAGEALDALAGGADIIDAKEPALGPLAPVSAAALQSISAALPPATPLSVALGDARPAELAEVVSAVASLGRRGVLYFKVALLSASPAAAAAAIEEAVRLLDQRPDRPALIVARYVDTASDAIDLGDWVDTCAASGAHGLLLDTSRKTGANLFASVGARSLSTFRGRAAGRGIWLALAGGMTIDDVELLAQVRPHVVGVRGAVCEGSRTGRLSGARVELLRRTLDSVRAPRRSRVSPA